MTLSPIFYFLLLRRPSTCLPLIRRSHQKFSTQPSNSSFVSYITSTGCSLYSQDPNISHTSHSQGNLGFINILMPFLRVTLQQRISMPTSKHISPLSGRTYISCASLRNSRKGSVELTNAALLTPPLILKESRNSGNFSKKSGNSKNMDILQIIPRIPGIYTNRILNFLDIIRLWAYKLK